MTRILVVIDSFYDGGAEIYAIGLANSLAKSGCCEVFFLEMRPWLSSTECQCFRLLDTSKVSYSFFTGNRLSRLYQKILWEIGQKLKHPKTLVSFGALRLNSLIQKKNIETVISLTFDSDSFFTTHCKSKHVGFVSSFHGHYELYEDSFPTYESVVRSTFARADAFIIQTQKHLKTLKKYGGDKKPIFWIEKGIDFKPVESVTVYEKGQTLKLVLAARCIKEKGWLELIEAVVDVYENHTPNIHLTLIGDGTLRSEVEKRISGKTYINYLGFQKNVSQFVKAAHVGVLLSTYEAECHPLTVTDYLTHGKPVIATANGEIDQMLMTSQNSIAGILVPIEKGKPSVEKTKEAILEFINRPESVREKSKLAIQASEKFSIKTFVNNHLEVFNSLNKKPRHPKT